MSRSITRAPGRRGGSPGRAESMVGDHAAYSLSMTTHEGQRRGPRVIHTAQALVDEVVEVDALPVRGGNAVAQSYARYAGGAVNILVAAARSGADAVLAGAVGTGANGDLVRAALAAEGVAVSSPPGAGPRHRDLLRDDRAERRAHLRDDPGRRATDHGGVAADRGSGGR